MKESGRIAVDTSALVAVVLGENDAERFLLAMSEHSCLVSAVTIVEAKMVLEARQGLDAGRDLDLLLEQSGAVAVNVTVNTAQVAVEAWRRFGKGQHPAALNFGDCFSYALAATEQVPLLYKGDDFRQSDIPSVL